MNRVAADASRQLRKPVTPLCRDKARPLARVGVIDRNYDSDEQALGSCPVLLVDSSNTESPTASGVSSDAGDSG